MKYIIKLLKEKRRFCSDAIMAAYGRDYDAEYAEEKINEMIKIAKELKKDYIE